MNTSLSRREFTAMLLGLTAASAVPVRGSSTGSMPTQQSDEGGFLHPGMLQSRGDLERMRAAVAARKEPIYSGFLKFSQDKASSSTYKSTGAGPEIGRNPNILFGEFDGDSNAAYQCALMWSITGNPTFAQIAISILDSWSSQLQEVSGADAVLSASLGGFKMANAAEIMRHTNAGWSDESARRFGTLLHQVFLPVIQNFAPFANGNWDTAAIKMMLAIAVYNEDRPLFERALEYYRYGCGDGRLEYYIYPSGQCQESGRDQQHAQLGLAHLGDCCEIAWHQGLDLYGASGNRLLLGFEYVAAYNLGQPVPFAEDIDRTGKYRHSAISPPGKLRPVYEQIYNHYARRKGLSLPWTAQCAEKLRPEGAGPGADHTGFGTLLYTRDDGPDTAESAAFAVPHGLHLSQAGSTLELDFIPLAAKPAYYIARSEYRSGRSSGEDWRLRPSRSKQIARGLRTDRFLDRNLLPSQLYMYQVSALNSHRLSLPAIGMAALPIGWTQDAVGLVAHEYSSSFDGTTYCLTAAGAEPIHQGGPFLFLNRMLPSNGAIVARFLPLLASQSASVGLALSGGIAPYREQFLLIIAPAGGPIERPSWAASVLCNSQEGKLVTVATEALTEPAISWGRIVQPIWMRIEQINRKLVASISNDGQQWNQLYSAGNTTTHTTVGMVVNSGIEGVTTEVCFDNVSVSDLP